MILPSEDAQVPEGGIRCYKEIIDQMLSLEHLQGSVQVSLTLAISTIGNGFVPSEADLETYMRISKPLANFLADLKERALAV